MFLGWKHHGCCELLMIRFLPFGITQKIHPLPLQKKVQCLPHAVANTDPFLCIGNFQGTLMAVMINKKKRTRMRVFPVSFKWDNISKKLKVFLWYLSSTEQRTGKWSLYLMSQNSASCTLTL